MHAKGLVRICCSMWRMATKCSLWRTTQLRAVVPRSQTWPRPPGLLPMVSCGLRRRDTDVLRGVRSLKSTYAVHQTAMPTEQGDVFR